MVTEDNTKYSSKSHYNSKAEGDISYSANIATRWAENEMELAGTLSLEWVWVPMQQLPPHAEALDATFRQ